VKVSSDTDQKENVNTTVAHHNVNNMPWLNLRVMVSINVIAWKREVKQGDLGVALEVLLSQYFKLGLSFLIIISNNSTSNGDNVESVTHQFSEILQQREDKKCVLESIYESASEERIANRLWVLNLQLDYLLDFFCDNYGRDKGEREPKRIPEEQRQQL
jgi:hypothetical protein